jgi:hypothetical protein
VRFVVSRSLFGREPVEQVVTDAKGTVMAQRICVTGAAGQAGRAVVRDLLEHGYEVAATDIAVSEADRFEGMLRADLTDYGQALEALRDAEAVVHLANIPAPGLATPPVTFNTNMTMNFNVFQAAANLGLSRVVWASSETTLGLPFDVPPRYAPVEPPRRSPGTSPSGRASRSSRCGSPTSGDRRTTTNSLNSGRTRRTVSGICGAI